MVIVDSTTWIDYLRDLDNPQTRWLDHEVALQAIGLTDLVLCEVLQGVRRDENADAVLGTMQAFTIHSTGGEDLAIASAQNYRILRSKGHTVRKTIDCIIATFCIQSGFSLLHNDRDFDPFENLLGLKVIHPERFQ